MAASCQAAGPSYTTTGDVNRSRGLRSEGFVHFSDFGDAVIWEDGFVRDESVREALGWLRDNGYVSELDTGLQLAPRGDQHLYREERPRHSARVYGLGDDILVKQMILEGDPPEYAIDGNRELLVALDDDAAIAAAMRSAVAGKM